jgi:multiple sugar transport system substrate-binding protein
VNITPLFNQRKMYADVSKEFSQLKVKDQLPAGLLRYCQHEGKTYQLPYGGGGTGLYWNKNLFEKVGLAADRAPRTWDEMTDAAVRLTRAPDVWGVTIPYNGSPTFEFMPWVYANGGKLLSDDGKRSAVNTEEGAGAFQLWNDLAQRRQVTPDGFRTGTTFNATEYFLQGKLAMFAAGTGLIARAKREAPDLQFGTAVRPVGPRGKDTGCSPGGETIGFLPNNKYRAETWRLMEWLIGPEVQVEHKVAVHGGTPILSGQYDNKYFKEEPRFLPFREAERVITPTWTTRFEDIKGVMLPAYMGTMRGEKEPRAALREMAEGIDRILAAP